MKKVLSSVLALLFVCGAAAQEFTVKSFEAKVTDLTAKVDPVLDLNGDACALVRVQIACKGCRFEGNIVGEPTAKSGEYLVYVPAGTRRLKITHPDYLPLTYEFNLKIEKNCTYELRITLPQHTSAIPELNSQFLVLKVLPADAIVFVNDVLQPVTGGMLSKELPFGEHTYRVEAPMHHPQRGTFTVSESGKTELSVALDPAYGFLAVTSSPESGARVFVDGKEVGATPWKSERMASGSYQIQVLKEGYYPQMQTVEVADNRTASLAFDLKANFATVTLQAADPEAEIRISGKPCGTGRWSGRLEAGTYSVESVREGYEKALQSITVEAGVPQTIRLQAQMPIYGILKISSTPLGATVRLDGKEIGETPLISNKVLIGTHRVELSAPGMVPVTREVRIVRMQTAEVEVVLSSVFGTVAVTSNPAGAAVRIDGREVGVTPLTSGNLTEGEHVVEIAMRGYAPKWQSVRITRSGQVKLAVTLEREDVVYNKALAAFKAGRTQTGFTLLTQAAEADNAAAQYDLGDRYYNGKGVKQDYTKGHYWWWRAALNGHEEAKKYIENTPQRRVVKNDKYDYYVYDGVKIVGPDGLGYSQCTKESQLFSEGLACIEVVFPAHVGWYYVDSRGHVIMREFHFPKFNLVGIQRGAPFVNGVAQVTLRNGKSYYIDHQGAILPYEEVVAVENNLIVKASGKYALLDAKFRTILPFEYEMISRSGIVKKQGKYGRVDPENGREIIPCIYDEMTVAFAPEMLPSCYYAVRKEGLRGIVDGSGKVVVPVEYDEIRTEKGGWIVIKDNTWGFVNTDGTAILRPLYDYIIVNASNFFVQKDNKWGLADSAGDIRIPMEYETITSVPSDPNAVKVRKYGSFYGLITVYGQVVVPCNYYLIMYEGTSEAERLGIEVRDFSSDNARWGLVDLAGNMVIRCKYKSSLKLTDEIRAKAMADYAKKFPEKYAAHKEAAKRLREAGLKEK